MRLRQETRAAHRRVEARLFPAALQGRGSYAAFLEVLLALHEPHEEWFARFPGFGALGIDLLERRKAGHLRRDLDDLDAPATGRAPAAAPPPDLATALGAFFVLEGSTLGGRVLEREARQRLGDVPTSFLAGYGEATGRRWHQTRSALTRAVAAADEPDAMADGIVTGAQTTFETLEAMLRDEGWPHP